MTDVALVRAVYDRKNEAPIDDLAGLDYMKGVVASGATWMLTDVSVETFA